MSAAIEQKQIWVDNTRIMKPTVLMKGKKLVKYCGNIFWLRVDIVAAKSDSTRCKKNMYNMRNQDSIRKYFNSRRYSEKVKLN